MVKRFPKDDVPMLLDAFLELLLQETTTMLILAHGWNFSNKVLEPTASIAVVCKISGEYRSRISIDRLTFPINFPSFVLCAMESVEFPFGT